MANKVKAMQIAKNTGRRNTPTNLVIKIDNSAGQTAKVVSLFDCFGFCESTKANDALISVPTIGGIAKLREYVKFFPMAIAGFSYSSTSKTQFSESFKHVVADFDGTKNGSSPLEGIIQSARSKMAQDQTLLDIPFEFIIHPDMDLLITAGIGQNVEINLNIAECDRKF